MCGNFIQLNGPQQEGMVFFLGFRGRGRDQLE